jgi:hypothetical protein
MLESFKVEVAGQHMRLSKRWEFNETINRIAVIAIIVNAVVVAIECENGYEVHIFSAFLEVGCLIELIIRTRSQGFLYLSTLWDLGDFVVCVGALMDLVEVLIYGHIGRVLLLRCVSLFRAFRVYGRLVGYKLNKQSNEVFTLFAWTMSAMFLTLMYSIVFFFILSFIGAVLVSADVLPSLTAIRSKPLGEWMSSRALFGSVVHSLLSMFEIITVCPSVIFLMI